MAPNIKSVELPDRLRLSYVEQGDTSGVPMMLLHGVTDSRRSFEPVLSHLPPSIHAFALTQRGHGDSDRPTSGYRTHDFAADVAAFADALALGSFVVGGARRGELAGSDFQLLHILTDGHLSS